MVVVTGGAGFIGYNLVRGLLALGHENIVVVDNNIERIVKRGHEGITYLSVEDSYLWLQFNAPAIKGVFHLGARTDTMEKDEELLNRLNLNYSKYIWTFCTEEKIPLIYASSAAVYGDGCFNFDDDTECVWDYYPMNLYGESKFHFDDWVNNQQKTPPKWAGLRFFNVYGPFESHKGAMASVVYQFYNQIKETGQVKLFKSHGKHFDHGEQKRDFIHVIDIVNVMISIYSQDLESSIYNLGTGKARSYNDLARAVFKSLGKRENITYIDIPEEIRDSYQYFTEARMDKLRDAGYYCTFTELEDGIDSYVNALNNGL